MARSTLLDEKFQSYLRKPALNWDLMEGALLIACQEYPDLSTADELARTKKITLEFLGFITPGLTPPENILQLNCFLFGEKGFRGNHEDYNDPQNSYIPDLLDRKKGIPISLAALYLTLGWAAQWPLFGINFPGHFLVAWKDGIGAPIYLDVFEKGRILDERAIQELWKSHGPKEQEFQPSVHLRNAGIPDILHRILANLKAIHSSSGRLERALWAAEWMLRIKPNDWNSLRDMGLFCYSLGQWSEARRLLEQYLQAVGRPPDYSRIWNVLQAIGAQGSHRFN